MKLDAKGLRYMTAEEFRVLTAMEMGSKNHEVVPTQMVSQIANLRGGGAHKILGQLARMNLVARVKNVKYDGYRLTYGGYDYLAMKVFANRGSIEAVGHQIGVGKESDIYIVADSSGTQRVLKIQRLGRISFRTIKNKRDYLQKRKSASWMYMSRLAAAKEFAFMKILHENGFPVPIPVDQNRHCIVMELVDGYPLYQIAEVEEPGRLYADLMALIVRFGRSGLIHGDFNEFNIIVRGDGQPVIIDFPQMVSTSHANAEELFDRDVNCIRAFFRKRFNYESSLYPKFSDVLLEREFDLDLAVSASGFSHSDQRELEEMMTMQQTSAESDHEELIDDEEIIISEDESEIEVLESIGAEIEHLELTDVSPSEQLCVTIEQKEEEEEGQIERNDNRTRKPFRDSASPTIPRQTQTETAPSREDIRNKVRQQLKKENMKTSARNIMKGRLRNKSGKVSTSDGW